MQQHFYTYLLPCLFLSYLVSNCQVVNVKWNKNDHFWLILQLFNNFYRFLCKNLSEITQKLKKVIIPSRKKWSCEAWSSATATMFVKATPKFASQVIAERGTHYLFWATVLLNYRLLMFFGNKYICKNIMIIRM